MVSLRRAAPIALFVAVPAFVVACGSAPPPPADVPATPASATPTAAPSATAAATTAPTPDKPKYDDPSEKDGVIELPPLLAKGQKTTFPKATTGDQKCWEGQEIDGDYQKDWDNITGKCGAPTGLVPYTKPVVGRLHHEHDKRDTYGVKLMGGYCYRYFAVADGTMKDLDILVEKPGGALVADDKTTSPVAIIHSRDAWCMDEDTEFQFHVEVDGPGEGHYQFGVYVRPKK